MGARVGQVGAEDPAARAHQVDAQVHDLVAERRPVEPGVEALRPRDEAVLDEVTGAPRSSTTALRESIARARAVCAEIDSSLVLVADDGLPADLLAELRVARDQGLPLVEIDATDAGLGIARKLSAVVAPLLSK